MGPLGDESEPMKGALSMKLLRLLLVAAAMLVWAAPASASYFYYHRTSLINSTLEVMDNYGDWTGYIRAGSGSGTDACQHNNWIPLGYYAVYWHDDNYAGSSVQGRVWRLSDYQCSNGVWRTELFVHSEETSGQGQSCGPAGTDYRFCWEGDHDYYSYGCIKVARQPVPSDLRQVDSFVHAYGMSTDLWVFS
jgi:hypothetical protein